MKKTFYITIISVLLTIPAIVLSAVDSQTVAINKFELIWSADTYTPYNYQGRNLPVAGSKITVDAVVTASGGNAKDLKYSWFLEDFFQQNKSGYGKNSFYFYAQQSPGAYHTVRLQIFNEDRTIFEEKTIQIPMVSPEIVFYSSSGNSHFSNQASTTSIVFADKNFSFVAKPYFFSIKKLTDLVFEWTLSGTKPVISSDYNASVFNLTISGKTSNEILESSLLVNVKNPKDDRQKAFGSMKINIY